jgi:O-antigen/teichoic acid export membrane protein
VVKAAFRRTYPLVLASLLYFPIRNIDIIYLERLGNITEFGLYSIGLRISTYLQVMINAVTQAFEPDIFRFVAGKNSKKLYTYIGLLVIVIAVILVGFSVFSEFIIEILTAGRYTAATQYANLNLIPIFTAALYAIFNKVLIAQKRTKTILFIEFVGGLSSLAIIKVFINYWQYSGALIAKGLVGLLLGILAVFFIKKNSFNAVGTEQELS